MGSRNQTKVEAMARSAFARESRQLSTDIIWAVIWRATRKDPAIAEHPIGAIDRILMSSRFVHGSTIEKPLMLEEPRIVPASVSFRDSFEALLNPLNEPAFSAPLPHLLGINIESDEDASPQTTHHHLAFWAQDLGCFIETVIDPSLNVDRDDVSIACASEMVNGVDWLSSFAVEYMETPVFRLTPCAAVPDVFASRTPLRVRGFFVTTLLSSTRETKL